MTEKDSCFKPVIVTSVKAMIIVAIFATPHRSDLHKTQTGREMFTGSQRRISIDCNCLELCCPLLSPTHPPQDCIIVCAADLIP